MKAIISVRKRVMGNKFRYFYHKGSYVYSRQDLNSFKEIIFLRGHGIEGVDEIVIANSFPSVKITFEEMPKKETELWENIPTENLVFNSKGGFMKLLLLLMILFSCQFEMPPTEVKQPTIEVFKGRWNNSEYDVILSNALAVYGKDLYTVKPSDYKDFINEWPLTKEGLTVFWSKILVEMAKYESGWKTATQYKENFKGSDGVYIISRGLYQLSHSSAKAYGCPLPKPESLHEPKLNIECAVVILNRWVLRDGRIAGKVNGKWLGGARYWSVLRQEVGVPKKSTDAIKKANKL